MSEKRIALVTGANKGIGLQIAKDLAKHGLTVLVGARNLAAGEKAAKEIPGAQAIELDVTKQASITAAAARIGKEHGHLDVPRQQRGRVAGRQREDTRGGDGVGSAEHRHRSSTCAGFYETNVFGVIAVTQALLPLLKKAKSPRIVNVSSGMGLARAELGPEDALRLRERGLRDVEDGAQRRHGRVRGRARRHEHQDQRGVPGLRRHRPQPQLRPAHRRAGRGRSPFASRSCPTTARRVATPTRMARCPGSRGRPRRDSL